MLVLDCNFTFLLTLQSNTNVKLYIYVRHTKYILSKEGGKRRYELCNNKRSNFLEEYESLLLKQVKEQVRVIRNNGKEEYYEIRYN